MGAKEKRRLVSFDIWDRDEQRTQRYVLEEYVVDGVGDGPHVVVVSGAHGDELLAIDAAKRMYRELDPGEVDGTVSFLPEANMFAVEKGTRETPVPEFEIYEDEERNLNRCFSSVDLATEPDGNITQRLAYHILDTVVSADYCFDLHTATAPGYKVDQIREKSDSSVDAEVRQEQETLVRNAGVPYILRTSTSTIGRGVLAGVAPQHGVPSVTVEIGGGMYTPRELDEYVRVIRNLLVTAGVIEGSIETAEQEVYGELVKISAPTAGEYTKTVPPGDDVQRGEVIGKIENDDGVHTVESPVSGLVESVHEEEWVNEGTKLGHIAVRTETGLFAGLFRDLARTLDALLARARTPS
ncbi:MAG: succinylglutamate desuccinylase/aspartoacylase family protein [Candidatus Nanohaloarchaea archaeon]|nr:succinylglutamate desuccinylase/aspartoacylase family protein [Candidatus Nanohaloarchaea archaeon]